jgi:hypothetical protein
LCDTLPHSIEALTFYRDEGLVTKRSFSEQLLEVLHAVADFPCLRSIVLEDVVHVKHLYDDPVQSSHGELARVCSESGVNLRIQPGRELSREVFTLQVSQRPKECPTMQKTDFAGGMMTWTERMSIQNEGGDDS